MIDRPSPLKYFPAGPADMTIMNQVKEELAYERWRDAVEKEKQRLLDKASKPWYKKLFPFKIKIERI